MNTKHTVLSVVECYELPENPDENTVYQLLPKNPNAEYYRERTDRNIGWITEEEQKMLHGKTIGIAGCGGMGGLLGQTFVRLGIGEIRIADIEEFDISNINRQFGATRKTIGASKAFVTAQKIRETSDDTTLVVYPQGITEETVEHFLDGCDVVCDEIEFWAVGARTLLHMEMRKLGVELFCCDTVGHRTYLFHFTSDSIEIEDIFGFKYQEAKLLQNKIQDKKASQKEIRRVMDAVIKTFIPEVPEYLQETKKGTVAMFYERLFEEGRAPIVATNPPMASGFIANHVLLHLLQQFNAKRNVTKVPKMPGYLYFDAATMESGLKKEKWW